MEHGFRRLNQQALEAGNLVSLRPTTPFTEWVDLPVPMANCPNRDGSNRFLATDLGNLFWSGDYAGAITSSRIFTINPPHAGTAASVAGEESGLFTGIIAKGGHNDNWPADNSAGAAEFTSYGKIGFASIRDGASNTIMFGEKAVDAGAYSVVGDEFYPGESRGGHYGVGFTHTNMRRAGTLVPDGSFNDVQDPHKLFGSAHPGTVGFVFGDGSTHSVNIGTTQEIIEQLVIRDDGSVVDLSGF